MSEQDQQETPGGTPDEVAPEATQAAAPVKKATRPRKKAVAKKTAAPAATTAAGDDALAESAPVPEAASAENPAVAPVKKATRPRKKAVAKKAAAPLEAPSSTIEPASSDPSSGPGSDPGPDRGPAAPASAEEPAATTSGAPMVLFQAPEKPVTRTTTRSRSRKAAAAPATPPASSTQAAEEVASASGVAAEDANAADRAETPAPRAKKTASKSTRAKKTAAPAEPAAEETPEVVEAAADGEAQPKPARKKSTKAKKAAAAEAEADVADPATAAAALEADAGAEEDTEADQGEDDEQQGEGGGRRRSRRRGGRRRRKGSGGGGDDTERDSADSGAAEDDQGEEGSDEQGAESSSKRRRTRTRTPKSPEDEIASVSGSTRLEAKKQRRREGREAGRRRAPIVSEAEFLARRESVERVMVIRQRGDLTQIAVLEDNVLVEHYVSRESQTSLIGNVYLGRVQNVLPSMEAAFIDIGKGRNAVLYAGEVNWAGLGHKEGEARKIESVLQSGQTVLVQVTKDPIGHKGARLTGQVSLPGRFLVYVPDGTTSGISRKLPDTERNRLKTLLKQIVPESAGVIVRTAAEGASEEELTQDVERLTARWHDIEAKVKAGRAPELLYGEPDLTLKVVRDLFTEDFAQLVVQGDEAWDLVDGYVGHVAPDLRERLERYQPADGEEGESGDVFGSYRIDEQIAKALDRKVWLPSGGSLIIDRTEAMTVVDVNTGKFTGSGGNLEETVTKNNLEAAEEIVRQLRLRDIGGIIVVDFIDMVLESNRDLVLRRLVECLGRDRTRHQVAEVTSLGLVQMTRKRIGTGLLEAFSEECTHCKGRGLVVHEHPIDTAGSSATDDEPRRRRSGRGGRARNGGDAKPDSAKPSPKDLAGSRPQPPQSAEDEHDATSEDPLTASPSAVSATAAESTHAEETGAPEVEPSRVESADSAQVDDSAEDAPASTASEAAVEIPAAPVVVTTTRRRRTATRPAGPPAGADGVSAALDGDRPSEDAPGNATEDGAETLDEAGQPIPHVPVKKKGSRKR